MDTNIEYLHDLRAELSRLAAAEVDSPTSTSTRPAQMFGRDSASRRWRVALALALVAVVIPVAAFAATPSTGWLHNLFRSGEPITPPRDAAERTFGRVTTNHATVVRGGTEAQREVLRKIVRGVDGRLVPIVRIGPPPLSVLPSSGQRHTTAWLYFPFPARDGVASQLAAWETRLVAGAFRDESAAQGLPRLIGATQPYPHFGPSSEGFLGPANPPVIPGNAARLTRLIIGRLHKMGLTPLTIRFAQPDGLAPVVIARTNDRKARLGSWKPEGWPLTDSRYEGLFFEVLNSRGVPVYFYAHTTRVQGGASSIGHAPIIMPSRGGSKP
jgi:hypothetical protein